MNNYILFLLLLNLLNTVISEYALWQNGEGPIIFNDPPSIQERTNFPFHNVQFESNHPRNFAEIPSFEKLPFEEREQTIGDKINALLSNQQEKQKVMEIVDSRNKSLLQKITELSRVFSKASRSHGIDQSELYHDMVETDRKRQNTLRQLRKSLTPEFIDIADKIVKVEKNFSLSDLQKQAGHDDILGSLAASAKSAMKDFESFLKSSPRTRRQLQTGPEWNMRSSLYVKPGTEGAAYIPDLPTAAPATNNNYADMLTKNRFLMPSPVEKQKFYPPAGFFPQEPTRPSVIFTGEEPYSLSGFTPPPPLTTTMPAPFGQDLSETYNDKTFADRNRLFRKPHQHYDDGVIVFPPSQQQQQQLQQRNYGNQVILQQQQPPPRWNIETQLVEKAQQTIIHTKTPITPDLSRNELTVNNKVENIRVPPGTVTNYSEQTISQAAIPAISNPPRDQVITKSHIETIRPAATGQSYDGSSISYPSNNNIPTMDVRVSPGSMPIVPANTVPLSSGAIGRYETDIGRYDTGEGRQNLRFEIPQTFLQNIQSKIPGIVETGPIPYQQNVVNSYGPVNPYRQSPYGSNTGLPRNYVPNNQPIGQQTYISNQYPPPPPGSYIPPGYQQKPSSEDTVNTRILTNEQFQPNIIPEPNTVVLKESTSEPSSTTATTESPLEITPYTTYPDFREDLFPIPLNHAKSDNRPASGTYLRRQDMFGGGTNEYRQDNGRVSEKINKEINNQKQWPSAVDDRRVKGYIDPEVRYGPASPPFSIENYPKPPYDGTSIAERPSGYMEGDDLSRTDMIGGIPYGRTEAMFTTPIPWNTQTTTIIGVPSIDIDPKLDFPGNRASRPTEKEIIQNRLTEDARKFPEKGQIRPYFGPEEITRSRYINENPPENNQRDGKIHRYVKIDLPNSSTLS